MQRRYKLFISLFIVSAFVYSGFWFYGAHQLKRTIKDYNYKSDNWGLSFSEVEVTGFPFNFKAKLKDIKYHYSIKNILTEYKAEISADALQISTNTLFSKFEIFFPHDTKLALFFNDKLHELNIISGQNHYLKLTEDNYINSFRVLNAIYEGRKITDEDFSLKELNYYADKVHFIDLKTGKTILDSYTDMQILINEESEKYRSINIKGESLADILDSDYVGHKFVKLANKSDINIKLRKNKGSFSIVSVLLDLAQLKIDDTQFNLYGSLIEDKADKEKLVVDITLKLSEMDKFIRALLAQNFISYNRSVALNDMLRLITGEEKNNNAEIKIFSSKDGYLRFGKIDMDEIGSHLRKLAMSD
jgi:hypothetical protein